MYTTIGAFKIEEIGYQWFDARIINIYEQASFYLGYDTPKELLRALIRLLEGESREEWICWPDEPSASIMRITLEDGKAQIDVFSSLKPAPELELTAEGLRAARKECQQMAEYDLLSLLDSIVTEFSLYETGKGRRLYEKHWMPFPAEELKRLKKLTRAAFRAQPDHDPENDQLFFETF